MKNNSRGFASALMLFTITLLSLLFISAGFINFAVQSKSDFRDFCYRDLREIQIMLMNGEKSLLALNPVALALRTRLKLLYAALAIAIATENWPIVPSLQNQISQTKQLQQELDLKQKMIISGTENIAGFYLKSKLLRSDQKSVLRSNTWSQMLIVKENRVLSRLRPTLAVSPDFPNDIAPVYKLNPNFETDQKIIADWSIWFFAKKDFQKLIQTEQNWSFQCSIEPQKNLSDVLIRADRL